MLDGYKDTEIGVIPIEWEVVKLQDYVKLTSGKFNPKKNLQDEKNGNFIYPVYGGNGITGFFTDYLVSNPTIIIGRVGEYCGSAHLEKTPIWITDNAIYTKEISPEFNIDFLYEIFGFIGLENLAERTGQPKITQEPIYNLKIPLPPLKEQKKIADILSTADDKIDAIASQIQKAEILKKGLLQKLLSEGVGHSEFKDSEIGKIPESWEIVELGNVSDILDPHPSHRAPKEEANGHPFVGIGDISENGIINLSSARKVSLDDVIKQNNSIQINENDIGFGRVASVGKIIKFTKYDFPFALSPTMAVVKAKQINNSFLYQFLGSDLTKQQFKSLTSGSTRIALGIQNLRKLLISLPALEEQKEIANILSTADEKLEVLRAKKEKYETLKKGLLQKLLSGEIRVGGVC